MLFNVPRTAACAALAAVLVAVLCESVTTRTAWLAAGGLTVLLAGSHLLARVASSQMYSLAFADTIIAGALLGALPTLAGRSRAGRGALLLGALSGILLAGRFSVAGTQSAARPVLTWLVLDPPPMALIVVAVVLVCWSAWTFPRGESAPTQDLPLRPVAAVMVLVALSLLRTDWLAAHDDWLFRMIIGIALTVIATAAAALLLPGRDGVLLAVAMAFTIAASAVVVSAPLPAWTIALLIGAVAAGVIVGTRHPHPVVAVVATIALAVVATTVSLHTQTQAVLIAVVVAAIGGYCLTVIVPQDPATLVIALLTFITPSIVAALVSRHHHGLTASKVWFHSPPQQSWAPGWAAVLVTALAAAIALVLPHLRGPAPDEDRTDAADNHEHETAQHR
ncbi:hypothetical protein ACWIGI_37745 [Nocardia sp. NPDC055321]